MRWGGGVGGWGEGRGVNYNPGRAIPRGQLVYFEHLVRDAEFLLARHAPRPANPPVVVEHPLAARPGKWMETIAGND
jgi:hypothetical protein